MYSLEEIIAMNDKEAKKDRPVRVVRKLSPEGRRTDPYEKRMACFHMDAELYSEGSEMGYCPTCGQQDIYLTFVD